MYACILALQQNVKQTKRVKLCVYLCMCVCFLYSTKISTNWNMCVFSFCTSFLSDDAFFESTLRTKTSFGIPLFQSRNSLSFYSLDRRPKEWNKNYFCLPGYMMPLWFNILPTNYTSFFAFVVSCTKAATIHFFLKNSVSCYFLSFSYIHMTNIYFFFTALCCLLTLLSRVERNLFCLLLTFLQCILAFVTVEESSKFSESSLLPLFLSANVTRTQNAFFSWYMREIRC